jgi:hypothetical protein
VKFLTQPCSNCPFRQDQHFQLRPERVDEIDFALRHDGSFHCHKDIARVHKEVNRLRPDLDEDEADFTEAGGQVPLSLRGQVEPPAFCGGALRWMEMHDLFRDNMVTRLGLALGVLPSPLPPAKVEIARDIFHMCEPPSPEDEES